MTRSNRFAKIVVLSGLIILGIIIDLGGAGVDRIGEYTRHALSKARKLI